MRDGIERLLSDPNKSSTSFSHIADLPYLVLKKVLDKVFLAFLLLFLPTQLGKHFWPFFSSVNGIRIDYLSPTFYFTDLLIIVLIFLNIKNIRKAAKLIRLSKTNNLIIVAIFLSVFLSILISPSPILGILKLIKILELILLGFVLFVNRENLLDLLSKILPFTIIFESLLAAFQFINKGSIGGIFYFLGERMFTSQTPNIANANILGELILRPYGTFPHPNVLAGFLLIATVYLLFNSGFEKNHLAKIAIFFGSFGILLSMSRISIILFGILVLVFFAKRKLLIPFLLITFSILFLFISPLRDRFVFSLDDTSIVERQLLLDSAVRMVKDSPLFGVGLNNFLPSLPSYYKVLENVFYLQPVHNLPLLIFSEVGLIGGVLILYLFYLVFRRANFESRILLSLIVFISLFDHYFLTLQQGQLLLTLVLVLSLIEKRDTTKLLTRMGSSLQKERNASLKSN